ncbi:hypothetical protein [Eisenbergiella massiliensis]
MSKTKPLGVYGERKNTVRCIINAGIKRRALKNADLKSAINENTLGKRKRLPETFVLGELWRIDDILHFTDAEILQMFGRVPKEGGYGRWKH